MKHERRRIVLRSLGSALVLAFASWAAPGAARADDVAVATVDRFARAAVLGGEAVGVGIGVIDGKRTFYRSFGYADASQRTPFTRQTVFQIASNTKVFTTNLLGQAVHRGEFRLADTLAGLQTAIGPVQPSTGQVTLLDLGTFTAGFPTMAPLCVDNPVSGCLPNSRPDTKAYGVANFLSFFAATTPRNYRLAPPPPVAPPAPYFYSDFSTGLLGLLLAGPPGRKVDSSAVDRWYHQLKDRILDPLGMRRTFLKVPASWPSARIAQGYARGTAQAIVTDGVISRVQVIDPGRGYRKAPRVHVVGGGGSGARAVATLSNGAVAGIDVTSGGSGYVAAPTIVFSQGGSTEEARARAIVQNGRIVAVEIKSSGKGYERVPIVTIRGGRQRGRDARAVARIANGMVTSVNVTDGGAGYVPTLAVRVEPGEPIRLATPVWAAAGSLSSTVQDLVAFAGAALGRSEVNGRPVPRAVREGFRIAMQPRACTTGSPDLKTCPDGVSRSGLAWEIRPADPIQGMPEVIAKNGGLPGFSSQIVLVPRRHLAVIVLVNSESDGKGVAVAPRLASDIAYGLLAGSH